MKKRKRTSVFTASAEDMASDLEFRKFPNKVMVGIYPNKQRSEMEQDAEEEAINYALSVIQNPELRGALEKKCKKGETVFQKARKEYFDKVQKKRA